MKYLYIVFVSLIFIVACEEEPFDRVDSKEIAVRYWGGGYWINRHDETDQINFGLASYVSKKDGYYSLIFDDHPEIHLPELKLRIYEIEEDKNWGTTKYHFDLQDNTSFIASTKKYDNYFHVRPPPLYRASVKIILQMSSKDPDNLYIIKYRGEYNY